jgi:selenocysteine lyase/cysteine desulfurase
VDEHYWQLVKEQFPLRPGLTIMNAANLCPSPYPVIEAVAGLTRDVDSDASFQNRGKFGELKEKARTLLARYLGAHSDEIAITRNTSEGNNAVINGLDLGPGDEVVIWDQNHPTNNVAWDVRADRFGYTVRRVSTPVSPAEDAELVAPFVEAITGRTRVLAFSHVSNISGIGLPAAELCAHARERGILTLVDGAQTFGALQLDLHQMGCDFYTGSSHKWLMGPKEAGVLYVRSDRTDELWPSDVGVGWASALENGAQKFDNLGQRDDAAVSAMGTAVDFHNTIAPERIEQRVRELATSLMTGLSERLPDARFHTPFKPQQRAGVVVFEIPGTDPRQLFSNLYAQHDVAGAPRGGEFSGVRLSPHIYNTMEDVNRVLEVVPQLIGH